MEPLAIKVEIDRRAYFGVREFRESGSYYNLIVHYGPIFEIHEYLWCHWSDVPSEEYESEKEAEKMLAKIVRRECERS